MRGILRLLLNPGCLTDVLDSLTVAQSHWVANKLGIYAGMHDFLALCPCLTDEESDE